MSKNVVKPKSKSNKWESPLVVSKEPLEDPVRRRFVEETEGRESKGHDPRTREITKASISEKEAQANIRMTRDVIKPR